MNLALVKKAERLDKKVQKFIHAILKKMGWGLTIPPELLSIIISFLYPSFLKLPQAYTLSATPYPIFPNKSYIVESKSGLIFIKTVDKWNSISDHDMRQVQLNDRRFHAFLFGWQQERSMLKFIAQPQIMKLINEIVNYFKLKSRGYLSIDGVEALRVMANKNLFTLRFNDHIAIVKENSNVFTSDPQITLLYDRIKDQWFIDAPFFWRKTAKLSRKKQFIRFAKGPVFEVEGSSIKELPMTHFSIFQQRQKIIYLLP